MLLECLTHRRRGHYEGDQQSYRDPAAEAEWERLDPIARLRDDARRRGWLDDPAVGEPERAARAEVDAAVEFARASPFPEPRATRRLVYAERAG
jgi:pyruvate dehydrogenase E1 component alpha subunit